jgi:hypothetical protein
LKRLEVRYLVCVFCEVDYLLSTLLDISVFPDSF